MYQLTLADALLAHELAERDRGMAQAAAHGEPLLTLARQIAMNYAKGRFWADGTVTIEDVRTGLDKMLGRYWDSGNWMGSVFKERDKWGERVWEPTGRWVQTTHRGGHARAVREWRLRA